MNTISSINQLKWDTRQRLAMIEATLLWEGRITSGILMELFGISRGQASKDFSLYHHLAEGNMIYDLNQKAYFPGKSFMPYFIRGTADEYLRLIEAGSRLGQSVVLPITPTGVGVELLYPPQRKLNFEVLRLVHQGIREKRQLSVTYQSMNRESRLLTLEPHTLVSNGFRWHIRAFSLEHQAYRDFVLARFLASPEMGVAALHSVEQDQDWQSFETLIIAPHPDLTTDQQAVIADDYGMEDGRLNLPVRRALKLYYLRMLHLDEALGTPKAQQIVWLNRDKLEPMSTPTPYD
ncbi:MAG: WYL domain-containing protein [Methylobacter sp.]|nr:WYL domain-containing protein [Methylobacter sp.]